LHSRAALREEVGVVPTVAVGDVFFATSRCCPAVMYRPRRRCGVLHLVERQQRAAHAACCGLQPLPDLRNCSAELLKGWLISDEPAGSNGTAPQLQGSVQPAAESPSDMQVALYTSEDAALLRPSRQVRRAVARRNAVRRAEAAEAAAAGRISSPSRPWWRPWQRARRQDARPDDGARTKPAAAEAAPQQRQMTPDISDFQARLEERKSLSAMSWGMALTVALEKCAGRALLQPDPVQVCTWQSCDYASDT
jgi:hypothetical protein